MASLTDDDLDSVRERRKPPDGTVVCVFCMRTDRDASPSGWAHTLDADADLVLLDEREPRQTARRHDLSMTGAIGVLLRASRTGDVDLQTELDAFRSAGFWISDDRSEEVLSRGSGGSE